RLDRPLGGEANVELDVRRVDAFEASHELARIDAFVALRPPLEDVKRLGAEERRQALVDPAPAVVVRQALDVDAEAEGAQVAIRARRAQRDVARGNDAEPFGKLIAETPSDLGIGERLGE